MIKKSLWVLLILFVAHKLCVWSHIDKPLLQETKFSKEFLDREGRLLRLFLSEDESYRIRSSLKEISPTYIQSTLLYEDRYFYYHFGVNPVALVKAFWSSFVSKERVLGASTISMQLSRSLYKIHTRTLKGKLEQIFRAIQIEFFHEKEEILEAYLNLAPYGFNIEGVGAASRVYFDKSPNQLSFIEAITLAVIPQSPYLRTKNIKRDHRPNSDLEEARSLLYLQWLEKFPGIKDKESELQLGLQMRPPTELPFYAPHLVMKLYQEEAEKYRQDLSLDLSIQLALEASAKEYLAKRKEEGIYNFSSLVIDTEKMEVLSYIGSANFFSDKISGQVNGVEARRSPGSALKPFVYALAMDQGIIHPMTMLKDTPTHFGTYTPDNFDSNYRGPLSAAQALNLSRNIPAVDLAKKVKAPDLYGFLHSLGMPLNPDPAYYGLSIVLGTAEITMKEILSYYAMLANRGEYRPIREKLDEPKVAGKKSLSAETSFMILDILSDNPKPDETLSDKWILTPHSVAWKTGTSVGYRDAWAIAVAGKYAIAVWVGNFSGEGNPSFVGRSAAGPLLFQFVEVLSKLKKDPFARPDPGADLNLTELAFCTVSGKLPHKDCQHKKMAWFAPGVSPIETCNIHRRVELDLATGFAVCPEFQGKRESRVFEYWPTDMLKLFRDTGIARKLPPQLHPICRRNSFGEVDPEIVSPKPGIVYQLRSKGADSKEIPLVAVADGNVKSLSWYINNQLVGKGRVDDPFLWQAKAGSHFVRVVDDHGRFSELSFQVNWVD